MVFSNNLLMGAAGQSTGYTIDQSIRFNDDDDAHLYNTSFSASPTSSTDCTFSTWVKRGNFGSYQVMVYGGNPAGSTAESIRFDNDEDLRIAQASSAYDLKTDQKFRDVAGWYHIVVAFDTDNATASERIKLYVNGERVTSFSTATYPSSGYSTNFTSGAASVAHVLGANAYEGSGPDSQHFDGYQAEINFVDGQVLDPTSFGETNSNTGQWVPVKYTGSYGTNGFYITGADSADLGADDSGNGNNFTSSSGGFTAADQVTDSPTDNYATLNPLLKHGSVTLADGNLEASSSANGWFGSVGTVGVRLGDKVYFEGKCLTNTRLYFGLSRINGSGGTIKPESDSTFEGGQSDTDYMWRVTDANTVYYQTTNQSVTVSAVSVNDIVGCSVDTNGTVKFYKNGTEIHSFSATLVAGDTYMPIYSVNGATSTEKWEVRFGSTGISHQPAGFSLLRTSDMADPTIADPSDYFQAVLDTGANIKTTAEALYTDQLEWIKDRDNANNHQLIDSVRGTSAVLQSNTTAAETTYSAPSGNSVGWVWKANGTGSSNTDGSITSTVSADTTSGFSIATYTGTGSAATIGHGLGVAPAMVIVKKRDSGTDDAWIIWHQELPGANYYLNFDTGAQDTSVNYWNNTLPTSSVFSVGASNGTNQSSKTFVAYCFAEVEGFSKFGSYTGNGSSDGVFVNTGFEVGFLMYKRTNAAESWEMYDSTRGFNVHNFNLRANLSNAEQSDVRVDLLSNGFKARSSNTAINASGSTYIYMAFASSPFKTATAQ